MNFNKIKKLEQDYINDMQKAINSVRNEYQEKFLNIVQSSLKEDIYFCSGMGSTSFYKFNEGGKYEEIENKTVDIINNLEWGLDDKFCFSLSLPYKATSKKILTEEVEKYITNLYNMKGGRHNAMKNGAVSPHIAHIRYFLGWKLDENIIL